METKEQKAERKKIIRVRMFYFMIIVDLLFLGFLVFEIIYALNLIK